MCMHCLEEGDWTDEDVCPTCKEKGHESPWAVSKCSACNKEYYDHMDKLMERIGMQQRQQLDKRTIRVVVQRLRQVASDTYIDPFVTAANLIEREFLSNE